MKIEWTTRTEVSPAEASRRIVTMRAHTVPFTKIEQDDEQVVATTSLGPVRIVDRMEIGQREMSGANVRGFITKTGPVLGGTLSFAAVAAEEGTIVGWRQDLTFLPCPALDSVLAMVMRIGYGLGFKALLR